MVLSTFNQSFSFHSSPESFISSRLQDIALSNPDLLPSAAAQNRIVEASILNRKVHIVSSYQLCKDILKASSSPSPASLSSSTITSAAAGSSNGTSGQRSLDADMFMAGPAYHQLMADFFPPPNLLLEDGTTHEKHKQTWKDHLSTFATDTTPQVHQIASKYISALLHSSAGETDVKIDLYDSLKSLSWDVLLGIFLDLSPSSSADKFSQIESLQETLLRGQFSLFPVSINARIWQSARSKGIKARKELQDRLAKLVDTQQASCPFLRHGKVSREDAASHVLLFTSSIAVKALTSLLTAFVLNLFLWRDQNQDDAMHSRDGGNEKGVSTSLAELIRSQGDPDVRRRMLKSILLETERLSPPVVGVMRRVQHDIVLNINARTSTSQIPTNSDHNASALDNHPPAAATVTATTHPIPANHDIWLYLSGASRDRTIFNDSDDDADLFRFDRYMSSPLSSLKSTTTEDQDQDPPPPPPLAFSTGPKSCLGTELVRQIVLTVGQVMVDSGLEMDGCVADRGVRAWLGWEGGVGAEAVARGMKQLPVQRPRVGIEVRVRAKGRVGV